MMETAIKAIIILVGFVIAGIIGSAAFAWIKRLWHLRRKDADELEVAELQAALQAVLDIYKKALRAKTHRPTRDQKHALKKKTKEFRKTRDKLRWEDSGYAQEMLSEWDDKVSGMPGTPGGQFGPLIDYACADTPDAVEDLLRKDFALAQRKQFYRMLRDNDVLARIHSAEILTEFREVLQLWRNPIAQPARENDVVVLIIRKLLELDRKVNELPEKIGEVVRECQLRVEEDPAQLRGIIEQLPTIFAAPATRRELLMGYPEPQTVWVGRVDELASIAATWRARQKHIYSVVGFGGQGKSALARRFTETLRQLENPNDRPVVAWWSFYLNRSTDEFFDEAAGLLDIPLIEGEIGRRRNSEQIARDIIARMRTGVDGHRVLLVLDGLEVLQETTPGRVGRIKDVGLYTLLKGILDDSKPDTAESGMVLITTREPLVDLTPDEDRPFTSATLAELSPTDGADLLINLYGLTIEREEAEKFVEEVAGHALTLTLIGALLEESGAKVATLRELRDFIAGEEARVTDPDVTKQAHRLPGYVLRHCGDALDDDHLQIMRLLSCCVRPATKRDFEEVFLQPIGNTREEKTVNDKLVGREYTQLRNSLVRHLCKLHLIEGDEEAGYDMHPLIRSHFYEEETGKAALTDVQRRGVHASFFEVLPKRQSKHHPDTMSEMEPLIDAVLHGCRADLAQRALDEVFHTRIGRMDTGQTTFYLSADLGASETNLQLLRAFFPDGDFSAEPRVSREGSKAYLISAAALMLMTTGRPTDAVSLFERGAEMSHRQSDWVNRSTDFRNLSELLGYLGRLSDAFEAATNALTDLEKVPASHRMKTFSTIFSHGYAASAAGQRGQDVTAAEHFGRAIELHSEDWLWGIRGGNHCTWLARSGDFDRARTAGEKNAAGYGEQAGLSEQTFMFATQGLVERLAWAAADSGRKTLDEMEAFADRAVGVGKRSGDHYVYTYALLEAGRCAAARAEYEPDRREAHVASAKRYLAEAESRANFAASDEYPGGYQIIHADIHVTRAQLAKLASDTQGMHEQCEKAIAICNDPTCDYAWAKQDALALLADTDQDK